MKKAKNEKMQIWAKITQFQKIEKSKKICFFHSGQTKYKTLIRVNF